MLENARAESAKIMKEAEKSIANEKEKAMDDAKYQIADLAILAAAKVIKKMWEATPTEKLLMNSSPR